MTVNTRPRRAAPWLNCLRDDPSPDLCKNKDMDREQPDPSKRLAVLKGHLNPSPHLFSCSGSGGGAAPGVGDVTKKKTSKSSAPISSSKDQVQKAFPLERLSVSYLIFSSL